MAQNDKNSVFISEDRRRGIFNDRDFREKEVVSSRERIPVEWLILYQIVLG